MMDTQHGALVTVESGLPGDIAGITLPAIIEEAGDHARRRFIEFFTADIRNANTRKAYARAVGEFLAWVDPLGVSLERIQPVHVAAYIEGHPGSVASVKQHLAFMLQAAGLVKDEVRNRVVRAEAA